VPSSLEGPPRTMRGVPAPDPVIFSWRSARRRLGGLITDHGVWLGFRGAACRNRTDDLFITSDRRWVFCRRLASADMPLSCGYLDSLSAGVARNRMPLAPRLAPQVSDL
jgi:hypothetical protein